MPPKTDPDHAAARRRAWLCLLLGLLSGLLLILGLDRATHTELPTPLLRLNAAERSLAPFSSDPTATEDWHRVDLPDSAPVNPNSELQHVWFRFAFELPTSAPSLWGLMLQRPYAAPKIWVNGALLADSGVERDPPPEYRHDLRYNLSPSLLKPGRNSLLILVRSRINSAGLAEVWLGDAAQMAAYKATRNRIEKTWPRIAVQVISLLAVALAGIFLVRRQDTSFGWFAAALACWALHTAVDLGMIGTQLPAWLVRPLVLLSLVWFVIFGLYFVQRLLGNRHRRIERAVLVFGTLSAAMALSVSAVDWRGGYQSVALYLVVPGVLAVGAVISAQLWTAVRARPDHRESRWLLILASSLLAIGVRDWLVDARMIGNWQSMRYLPFAAPMVFLVFGGMLLRRYAQALATAEQTNRQLAIKVAEKTAEMERSWRRTAEIDKERARFEERDRLMREMHDGVGGQLVQALALADRGESGALLREPIQTALDDLRLLIDASDVHSECLNDPLARLRERLASRLTALGIRMEWDFTQMPDLPRMSAQDSLQVLRILQELITNVVKHARADRISLSCKLIGAGPEHGAAQIQIEVSDNGIGFDSDALAPGRGMASLAQRSRSLGGCLSVESVPAKGTRALLRFPVPADAV